MSLGAGKQKPLVRKITLLVVFIAIACIADTAPVQGRRNARPRKNTGALPHRRRDARQALLARKPGTRIGSRMGLRNSAGAMARPKFPFRIAYSKVVDFSPVRTDTISAPLIQHTELARLINPRNPFEGITNWKEILTTKQDKSYLKGFRRKRRLYCRVGNGFHLEIRRNGKVRARHDTTKDSIMEIFSVKAGVVGIKSFAHNRYLCMNRRGKLLTRKSFGPECEFRENVERNKYNSYASELYSDHERRKGYFLAISKNGKPRRGRNVSWRQKRAHWLALQVRDG